MDNTEKYIEKIARIICIDDGSDPNHTLGGDGENFLWHEYEHTARKIFAGIIEPLDV